MFEVLETVERERSATAEKQWIRRFAGPRLCNVTGNRARSSDQARQLQLPGFDVKIGSKQSPEHKAKISAATKGKPKTGARARGVKRTQDEYATRRGRIQSPEERAKHSHPAWNKGMRAPSATCVDCGAELQSPKAERCYRHSAIHREALKKGRIDVCLR